MPLRWSVLFWGMEAEDSKKMQLVQAYADSIKMIWVVMAALSGAVFISSLFVKGYSLNQKHETIQGFDHGDREMRLDEEHQSVAN